jgi:hypothetical protein
MSHHNLTIESYSLDELLDLFQLDAHNMDVESLKRAKKQVLMMHPDKSKLPPDYFLFYKKAFDIIVRMYDHVQKVSHPVSDQNYVAEKSDISNKQFRQNLGKIPPEEFQKKFHSLFEQYVKKPVSTEKHDWFSSSTDTTLYDQYTVQNATQMSAAIDQIKERQKNVVLYKGVGLLPTNTARNSLYEGDDENEYVECDPFSKLKFEDLRKVHRDQTVFAVRDSDLSQIHRYNSIDEYQRARDVGAVKPIERSHAERIMEEQEQLLQARIRKKQFESEMNTMRQMEVNKHIMANFLQLGNH